MNESKELLLNKKIVTCDDGWISLLLGRDAAAAAAEGLTVHTAGRDRYGRYD